MKYFRAYLTDTKGFEDIDISVHCDLHIFQWLMQSIKEPDNPPSLDVGNLVSILISSDFLQMDSLVKKCLRFFKDNASQIIKRPIDLDCISPKLLNRLAHIFRNDELDQVRDKRDKVVLQLGKISGTSVRRVACRKDLRATLLFADP